MYDNQDRLMQLQKEIESIMDMLGDVPSQHRDKAQAVIDQCRACINTMPAVDTPVYIHITGTDKSFKTSYLLDLFDNDDLRDAFSVKMRNTSENTAVPCLVEPSSGVDAIIISQVSIRTGKVMQNQLTPKQFRRLYDLSFGAEPNDYLIRISIPADQTPMIRSVIEYPGIKEGADSVPRQKERHRIFQENMLATLVRYPGILVACFQHKIAIPIGHPMDAILKKYGDVLKTDFAHHKLPLVLSLQGDSAVASYCGNTNVEKDLQNDFKSYKAFESVIQLVNPFNGEYPVSFIPPGPHVDAWIGNLSKYKDLEQIKKEILKDGGVSWSRKMLDRLCTTSHIREALGNMFLAPWIKEAVAVHSRAVDVYHGINNYDEVTQIKERVRKAILNETYQPLRHFFNAELSYTHDGIIVDHQVFWTTIFSQYLGQFFQDPQRSQAISKGVWDVLTHKLDPENKGFLGTREPDLPQIIMNMAELFVPNALMRGDFALLERRFKEKPDVV